MGYIDRGYLLPFAMDKKLLVSELPPKIETDIPQPVKGGSGKIYRLFAGESSIAVIDLNSSAKLEAAIKHGFLTFELITRPAPKERRYNMDFDAKRFVGAAIWYLEQMGNNVSTWRTEWNYGNNFEQYRENLKNAKESHETAWSQAAWETWTGRLALAHGYDQVVARSKTDISAKTYIFDFIRSAF